MKKSLKKAKGKTSKKNNKDNLQSLNQEEIKDVSGGVALEKRRTPDMKR